MPGNATPVRHVPHAEVLLGVVCVVTQAGHGTVTASPADGVPLAIQVQALGAGRMLDDDAAGSAEVIAISRRRFRPAHRDHTVSQRAIRVAASGAMGHTHTTTCVGETSVVALARSAGDSMPVGAAHARQGER
jgi:hypothetical protein